MIAPMRLRGCLRRLMTRAVDCVITISESNRRDLTEVHGLPAKCVRVVLNGVPHPGEPSRDEVRDARRELGASDDDVLRHGVQGIAELVTVPGYTNVDFADVKYIMKGAGSALMGIGHGKGENRAIEAAKAAIESPLLETSINGATGILFTVTCGTDLSMFELNEAASITLFCYQQVQCTVPVL